MAEYEVAEKCLKLLQAEFGLNFGRSTTAKTRDGKTLAGLFIQGVLDRLFRCSDVVCEAATNWILEHGTGKRKTDYLTTERLVQAITIADGQHHEPDRYCPEFDDTVACQACQDYGITTVLVVREFRHWPVLYEMAEPCRADGCEAADRMRHFGRVESGLHYEVVARFDHTQLREEQEFRQDWWAQHRDSGIPAPPDRTPQGGPTGERKPRRLAAVLSQQ